MSRRGALAVQTVAIFMAILRPSDGALRRTTGMRKGAICRGGLIRRIQAATSKTIGLYPSRIWSAVPLSPRSSAESGKETWTQTMRGGRIKRGAGTMSFRQSANQRSRILQSTHSSSNNDAWGWEDYDPEDDEDRMEEDIDTDAISVLDADGREIKTLRKKGDDELLSSTTDVSPISEKSSLGVLKRAGLINIDGLDDEIFGEDVVSSAPDLQHLSDKIHQQDEEEQLPSLQDLKDFGASDSILEKYEEAIQDDKKLKEGGLAAAAGIKEGGALDKLLDEIVEQDRRRQTAREEENNNTEDEFDVFRELQPETQDYLQSPQDELDREIAQFKAKAKNPDGDGDIRFVDSSLVEDGREEGEGAPRDNTSSLTHENDAFKEMLQERSIEESMQSAEFQKRLMDNFDFDDDISPEEEDLLFADDEEGSGIDDFVEKIWSPQVGDWVTISGLAKATQYNNMTGQIMANGTVFLNGTSRRVSQEEEAVAGTEEERFTIQLTDGKRLSVKRRNIELAIDPEKAKREEEERELRKIAEKYFQIFATAGAKLEEKIVEHDAFIDATLLKLIENRIETEELQSSPDMKAVNGLKLLLKRLKKVLDRRNATPSLRLLDDCMALFSFSGDFAQPLGARFYDEVDENAVQDQIKAKLRVAFFGAEEIDRSLGGSGDLLSLASVISTNTGQKMVKEIFNRQINPETFMDEVADVVKVAKSEQDKLKELLQQIDAEMRTHSSSLTSIQMGKVRNTRMEIVSEIDERKRVMESVAKVLSAAEDIRVEADSIM